MRRRSPAIPTHLRWLARGLSEGKCFARTDMLTEKRAHVKHLKDRELKISLKLSKSTEIHPTPSCAHSLYLEPGLVERIGLGLWRSGYDARSVACGSGERRL